MKEEKCEWKPELHDGKPCPIHSSGSGITENNKKFIPRLEYRMKTLFPSGESNPYYQRFINKFSEIKESEQNYFICAMKYQLAYGFYQAKGKGFFTTREGGFIDVDINDLFDSNTYVDNGVIFHEMGHCIDAFLGRAFIPYSAYENSPDRENYKNYIFDTTAEYDTWERGHNYCISNDYKSPNFDNKSMNMMIKEEGKDIDFDTLDIMIDNERKEELKKINQESNKVFVDIIKSNLDFKDEDISENIYKDGFINWKYINDNYPEAYSEIKEKYDQFYKKKMEVFKKYKVKYGDLSDMCQAVTGRSLKSINMGHDFDYFLGDENDKAGKEFFAEAYQGKTVNSESYKVLKQCFPKTMGIFEEILDKFEKEVKEVNERDWNRKEVRGGYMRGK